MHQIKYLKPLTISRNSSAVRSDRKDPQYELSTTISLTNDLGEQFFYGETVVTFQVRLYEKRRFTEAYTIVSTLREKWSPGNRAMNFKACLSGKELNPSGAGGFVSVYTSVDDDAEVHDAMNYEDLDTTEMIDQTLEGTDIVDVFRGYETEMVRNTGVQFIPISSDLLEVPQINQELPIKTDRIALRTLNGVKIYEELSGSIARHLWDAGNLVVSLPRDELISFLFKGDTVLDHDRLNILELGTGIGVVSIKMSKHFPNSKVCATDLDDAREICQMNIDLNGCDNCSFEELDWEVEEQNGVKWDVIIVTDCTYNPLYYDALLHVLQRESSSHTVVLIAHKFREPLSESEFFTKCMANFTLQRQRWYSDSSTLIHMGLYRCQK